jgi:thioredoxin-like negative regulator of GroEL
MHNDLETFLHEYLDLVLVNFWEEETEASQYMEQLLDSIEALQNVPILRLKLAEHRNWAAAHGVYGTPALVAYYGGQPLLRISGRVTPEELHQRFQKFVRETMVRPTPNRSPGR